MQNCVAFATWLLCLQSSCEFMLPMKLPRRKTLLFCLCWVFVEWSSAHFNALFVQHFTCKGFLS